MFINWGAASSPPLHQTPASPSFAGQALGLPICSRVSWKACAAFLFRRTLKCFHIMLKQNDVEAQRDKLMIQVYRETL